MEKLTIFYDGACYLCNREIDHYKKVDNDHKLNYIDIALSNFEASKYGLDSKTVQKYFHVRDKDHNLKTGVEAFYLIWKELDIFTPLQKLYKFSPTALVMNSGYLVFAEIRPYLPKRKYCDNGTCYR